MRHTNVLHATGELEACLTTGLIQLLHLAVLRILTHLPRWYNRARTALHCTDVMVMEVRRTESVAVVAKGITTWRDRTPWVTHTQTISHYRLNSALHGEMISMKCEVER